MPAVEVLPVSFDLCCDTFIHTRIVEGPGGPLTILVSQRDSDSNY
jgi:hypothetical protein